MEKSSALSGTGALPAACGCSAQRGESEPSQSSEPGSQSSESGSQTSEPAEEKPALPIQDSTGWSEGMAQIVETAAEYFIEQRDGVSDGELTEADVTRLWYLVNTIYDADDVAFADEMAAPPEGVPAGILSKFVDFDEATRIFSPAMVWSSCSQRRWQESPISIRRRMERSITAGRIRPVIPIRMP